MKKLIVLALLIGIVLIGGVAQAEISETYPAKVCASYNLDDHRTETAVGTSIKKDVFVKGLDIDFLVSSDTSEVLSSDEINGIVGASYNKNITDKLGVLAGIGLGFKDCLDIQQIRDKDNIEIDKYAYAGISYKW